HAFGLQKAGGEPYELDMDKVLRIVNTGIGQLPETVQIDPWTIARLLGVENKYGLSIRIMPALNLTATPLAYYDLKGGVMVPSVIKITVKTPEGRPAISANVTGIYVLMVIQKEGGEDVCYVDYLDKTSVVNPDGYATLDFSDFLEDARDRVGNLQRSFSAAIIYADYYGIRAVNSSLLGETDVLQGSTVGDYLIVRFPEGGAYIPGARHLKNQTALANPPYYIYLSRLLNETNGESGMVVNRGAKDYRVYRVSNTIDEDVAFIMMPVKYLGRYYVVNFRRPTSTTICQIGLASGNIKTSVLRRMVKIGSFHYVFEVRVWRWGE
ncbi:MAG: hypothetical protein FGF53_06210, partial [Candidatus Brockarchaeota archaeon]|nr:hypothetical protein [Candidatus Brockarchaeota archaeon]